MDASNTPAQPHTSRPEPGSPRIAGVASPASVRAEASEGLGPMLGRAPAMRELFRRLERLSRGDAPVLLAGETGTGKHLAALTLHALGPCPAAPFLCLDLDPATWPLPIPRGATLFVREVGDLPPAAQRALLELLERAPRRSGGQRLWRLVCSTGRDLSPEVARGTFRRDLYARLCGAVVAVPSLRERRSDLPLLVERFLAEAAARHRRPVPGVRDDAMELLAAYAWEGNVRELRREIERAVVFAGDGEPLAPRHLSPELGRTAGAPAASLKQRSRELERRWISRILAGTGWNVAAAAREMGISRVGLTKKIRTLDLRRPARGPQQ
jgi:DNA-binding NtrC family response regulator